MTLVRTKFLYFTGISPFNLAFILFNISDDEELSYVYFNLDSFRYFTIAINTEEYDLPCLEFNDQTYTIQSRDFYFKYDCHSIEFIFGKEA